MLKHCSGEVVEAMQAFTDCYWNCCNFFSRTDDEKKEFKIRFADELADVIICALIAAEREDVDIEAALLRVQEKNAMRAEQ
ncbi:MAG: hypothetical protein NC041_07000 [Bacteroides sp.]|nr:hypothetical protein [Prevotella sp.]MCM1407044.1 hypothetical protein [Treponema brennaborense]MCM1470196.1 hypothetical protein [Bacteroides sp.]